MQMPENYNETQINEGFERIEAGGHYGVIKQVSEKKSSTGLDMLVILFDFDEKDKQKGYFMKRFNEDDREDKKYPNDATNYMVVDKSSSYGTKNLKSFITMVENSNTGFKVQWGDNFCAQFKGKKIGCVFGPILDFYNGKEHKKTALRWFCSTDKVSSAEIPAEYETKAHKDNAKTSVVDPAGFVNIPDLDETELPFN